MNLTHTLSFLNGLKSILAMVDLSRSLNLAFGSVNTSVRPFPLSCLAISIVLADS